MLPFESVGSTKRKRKKEETPEPKPRGHQQLKCSENDIVAEAPVVCPPREQTGADKAGNIG